MVVTEMLLKIAVLVLKWAKKNTQKIHWSTAKNTLVNSKKILCLKLSEKISIIKYTYLGSRDFNFYRRKSFPNSIILKEKTVNWRFFQKHAFSIHVPPSTILNIFEKFLQYNEIYIYIYIYLNSQFINNCDSLLAER